jgi:hypothetical protein
MPRWSVALVVGFGALAVGGLVGWSLARGDESAAANRLRRIEARLAEADEIASELVEALGPLCGNFDFWFKHDMARGAFRPVRCSKRGRSKTVCSPMVSIPNARGWRGLLSGAGLQTGEVPL